MLAASYPFLDVLWTMVIFFVWILWFILLFRIIADIFRRHDIHGGAKSLWLIFVILLPFLGVFIYLITQGHQMTTRDLQGAQASQQQFDEYVRNVSSGSGSAAEIEKAKSLLDSGAITQAEFDALKAKALAA
jgi:predicted PurR-regulated permease PerM